jgi:hypothetical protein
MCPICGSENVTSNGYEDGAGDYGNGVSESFSCEECGERIDGDVYDPDPLGLDDEVYDEGLIDTRNPPNLPTKAMLAVQALWKRRFTLDGHDIDDIPF